MKNIILLAVLLICNFQSGLFAQGRNLEMRNNKNSNELMLKIFGADDADFKLTEVPAKWKGESAVILAQKFDYDYTALGQRYLFYKESTRKRVKLIDKAAVENFSTFYFYGKINSTAKDEGDGFGIQITKPDGTIRYIEKKDAIKVEPEEVTSIYRSRFYGVKFQYYKVAIADLEPGDIMDYYLINTSDKIDFMSGQAYALPPVITTMSSSYPIANQKINFVVERGFFINFKSSNGAPDLKKNVSEDRKNYSFSLVDQNRNKTEDMRWLYEYREFPTIKFQVCFGQLGKDSKYFLGKADEPTTSVSKEDVAKKVNFWHNENKEMCVIYVDLIKKMMKEDHGKTTNKEDIVKWSYYYFRNVTYITKTRTDYWVRENGYIPSYIFASTMKELLEEYDISAEICVAPERSISSIENVVIAAELTWFIKVNDKFIFPFTKNSNYDIIDPDIAGQDAYIVKIARKDEEQTSEKFTVPIATCEENYLKSEYKASLKSDMETIEISASTSAVGNPKVFFNYTALGFYDSEQTDHLSYGAKKMDNEKGASRNVNKIAEEKRQKEASEAENQKNTIEALKDELKDNFSNVISYDEFQLISDGRSSEQPELSFTEKYQLGDIIKKIGGNYSVDIGTIIGKQVGISKEEIKRDYNAWLSFARTSEYVINLEVPMGYKVEGLESLKTKVDNTAGSFSVDAKVDGQKLILNIKKIYKNNYVSITDWPKMVDFLDAAYNFTQKKIILVKSK
jgi:hypothetical protein